jgi:hypothetical protein
VTPSSTPTSAPTAGPASPVAASVWRSLDGFPPADTSLSSITAVDDGFVLAGSTAAADVGCATQRQARIWASADGLEWAEQSVEGAIGATVDAVSDAGIAIGRTGSPGCEGSRPVMWRAAGDGWQRLPTAGLDTSDEVEGLVALDGETLIASGHFADDEDAMGLWSVSLDATGSHWERATTSPPSVRGSTLTGLASSDEVVVGFDVTRNPHAWYSLDHGRTWASSDYDASYGFLTTNAVHGTNAFMAAGRACCGLPEQRYGLLLRSEDGRSWAEARPDLEFAKPIEAVLSTEMGRVALGEEVYLSADGTDWRLGPPLPGFVSKQHTVNRIPVPYRLAVVANGTHVVAITPDHAWMANVADLQAAKWPSAAPRAVMPMAGGTYEATLPTHCGPFNGPLYFDGRSWIPDLPGGSFPLSFDYYYETGSLKFAAEDRLEFTGAKGDVITYLPTDDPPHGAPCH